MASQAPQKSLYIFVGTHKTGSTALHHELRVADGYLRARDCRYDPDGVRYAKELLQRGLPTDAFSRRRLKQELAMRYSAWPEQNIILLSEHFMGNPYNGYRDAEAMANEMVMLFDGFRVQILMSVRRQDHFIESWYHQSVKEGGEWTFDEYLSLLPRPKRSFDWDRLAQIYVARFGKEHVRVISYAHAFADPSAVIDRHFSGWAYEGSVPIKRPQHLNPSLSPTAIELARIANRKLDVVAKRSLRNILQHVSVKGIGEGFGLLSTPKRRALLKRFESSNDSLLQKYGLDEAYRRSKTPGEEHEVSKKGGKKDGLDPSGPNAEFGMVELISDASRARQERLEKEYADQLSALKVELDAAERQRLNEVGAVHGQLLSTFSESMKAQEDLAHKNLQRTKRADRNLAEWHKELSEAVGSREELMRRVRELKRRLETKTGEELTLTSERDELRRSERALRNSMTEKEKVIADLKVREQTLQATLAKQERSLIDLRSQLAAAVKERDDLLELSEGLRRTLKVQKKRVVEASERMQELNADNTRQQIAAGGLRAEVALAQHERDEAHRSAEQVREMLRASDDQLARFKRQVEDLEAKEQNWKNTLSVVESERDGAARELNRLERTVAELKRQHQLDKHREEIRAQAALHRRLSKLLTADALQGVD